MVEQIRAEAPHFSVATIDAWQRAGPPHVRNGISRRLELADGGLLGVDAYLSGYAAATRKPQTGDVSEVDGERSKDVSGADPDRTEWISHGTV